MQHEYKILFLPDLQKYVSISSCNILKELGSYVYSHLYDIKSKKQIDLKNRGKIHVLIYCIGATDEIDSNQKKQLLDIIESMIKINYLDISFHVSKSYCSSNYLNIDLLSKVEKSISSIELFNNLNKQLKSKIKEFNLQKPLVKVVDNNQLYKVINWSDLLLPQKKLSSVVKNNYKYLTDNFKNVLEHCLSRQQYNARTDNSYVVYCKNNSAEGFLSKDHKTSPLNEALTFYDAKKAQRSCIARGITNYQIWQTSTQFIEKVIEKDCENGVLMDSIIAKQEKELLAQSMQLSIFNEMQKKIAYYEKILQENNLSLEIKANDKKINKL